MATLFSARRGRSLAASPGGRPGARPGLAVRLLADALLVLAVLVGAGWGAVAVTGHRVFVVASGSMRPTLQVGDLVVSRATVPADLRPGDIVTFRHPGLGGELVTHRVVRTARVGDRYDVVTRGDANSEPERWSVAAGGTVGRAVALLPGPGPALLWLRSGAARALAVLLVVAGCGGALLRRIWVAG